MGFSQVHAQQALTDAYAGELTAQQAWDMLGQDISAVLIDVRTPPEWAFSGEPDLSALGKKPSKISWKLFPSYAVNDRFVDMLKELGVSQEAPLLFLCRTGGRSLDAAIAATEAGFSKCYNITDGLEGPANDRRQRGMIAGWKAAGLPWIQS